MSNTTGKKFGGRTKGTPNKNKVLINYLVNHFTESGFDKFNKELNSLKGKDYVNAIISLMKISTGTKTTSEKIACQEYLSELLINKINKL